VTVRRRFYDLAVFSHDTARGAIWRTRTRQVPVSQATPGHNVGSNLEELPAVHFYLPKKYDHILSPFISVMGP